MPFEAPQRSVKIKILTFRNARDVTGYIFLFMIGPIKKSLNNYGVLFMDA